MIRIKPGADLDDKQKRVIARIQPFTASAAVTLTVTRGHDSPLGQLATIEDYARRHDCLFLEFRPGELYEKHTVWLDGKQKEVYLWQQTWSMLLHKGVIINPPLAAECLFDYFAPGRNKKGEIILPSPHILSDPLDFSGRVDRHMKTERVDIALVAAILTKAKNAGAGIRAIKPEPANVCVHIDLEKEV